MTGRARPGWRRVPALTGIRPEQQAGQARRGKAKDAVATPTVGVCIVTWNRASDVDRVLDALSRQRFPTEYLHVFVIDNASTDGTEALLTERWSPDRIVDNPTERAEAPAFSVRERDEGVPNRGGFGSLTIVRNTANLGGCGGFNTGFRAVEAFMDSAGSQARPDFVWLVDDDIDLPPDALEHLVGAAVADPEIGLVGSRTVDLGDRERTIESTIYFNPSEGVMADEPEPGHPSRNTHEAWAETVGGPKGGDGYTGLREVDVVSACSLLARWSAVREVGYWDTRFFIYCDDADWCLRFGNAGKRVVLNLDAVVYHTPWHHKLTPARLYYAKRNLLWMIENNFPPADSERMWRRHGDRMLKEAMRAVLRRRLVHAEIVRRSVADAMQGRGGKLDMQIPGPEPLAEALRSVGAAKHGASVVLCCPNKRALQAAAALRDAARDAGISPRWIELVHNRVPGAHEGGSGAQRVVYSDNKRSKIRRQFPLLLQRSVACVVFDHENDFPLLAAPAALHIDTSKPESAVVERQPLGARIACMARVGRTMLKLRRSPHGPEPRGSKA